MIDGAKAIELAHGWLGRAQLLPGGIDGGRATRPTPDRYLVVFHPSSLGSLVVTDPAITVSMTTDGKVLEVNYRWPHDIALQPTEVKTAQAAWAEAAAKGYLEVDQPVPANNSTTFTGIATVTKVSAGWGLATASGTTYLVPVYVFEGTVVLDNGVSGKKEPIAFRIYVQATP